MTYQTEAKKAKSKKNILAILRSKKELKQFTSLGSNNYEKVLDFIPEYLYINGSSNTFTFNETTKTISFNFIGAINNAFVVYKHFFASSPVILPVDFNNGYDVEFDSRINQIGELKLELDYENTNIALESSSSIQLENNDGFFDNIFDHIWENQAVEFYSYFESLSLDQIKLIYKGSIENKSFSSKYVTFFLKDRFYALRKKLQLTNFQSYFGSFPDSLLNKPTRRIYGKVSKLRLTSLSQQKGIIYPNGTISGSSGATAVTGVGTSFLTDLCPGDKLVVSVGSSTKEYSIKTINSDTSLDLSENIDISFSAINVVVKTSQYSRHYNRKWIVAGHLLHEENQQINDVVNNTTIEIADASDYEVDDLVSIGASEYYIRSIKGNIVRVNQNISPVPSIGDFVSKVPVYKAYYGINELVYSRDYTIINSGSYSAIVLNSNAEENITPPIAQTVSLTFTNGNRTISRASGTVDLKTIFKARDLIKPNNVSYSTYFEILDVQETSITIRSNFTGVTITSTPLHKSMKWIEDDSIICVDCVGKENATYWIKTASDIVKDILVNDAGYAVNTASFDESKILAPYKLSGIFPENDGDDAPTIKDVIAKINASVFGSLFYDNNYDFKYSILNSTKGESIDELSEDDVINYSVISKNNIINKGSIEFRPETDLNSGDAFLNKSEKTSDFVNLTSGIESEASIHTLIYDDEDAQTILERFVFFRSLANSIINIKAKLNLSLYNLNDVISVSFDRIYRRYGGQDKRKIGLITSISKNETESSIVLSDMSNVFNRVPSIAPDTLVDLSTAADQEIAKYGFIVDNILETPDNTEDFVGANLIG